MPPKVGQSKRKSAFYLDEVDRMLERAKAITRYGKVTDIEYARYVDDVVVLVNAHPL